jgi:hypothetical protein
MIEDQCYAVVSCHVERLLDDRTWSRFSRLQERMPGGFRVAALLRPPDENAGEAVGLWLERAREAAARSPIGHHTHWGGSDRARPVSGRPEIRVRREGAWLKSAGLMPTLFCGGGWYVDSQVAQAAADLDYADCTATTFRPSYLAAAAPQLRLSRPCWLELPTGHRLLELPTTHSLGMLTRALIRRRALDDPLVHVYFHDTDLLDRGRAGALYAALALLAKRRVPADFDRLVTELTIQDIPSTTFAMSVY